ncbi:hypothetical protein Nisw_08640 [Candidatus Nitrosopumilus sp. SW]|uniref:hypothetical protein n=1 Tax=Candidatus Nitrosopumilus sp. SW TaxID=2508726 RepID=UPI0011513287|nr:hypothetical protein [Candidatus Nitrosopumilus sp. SW]QDI89581.1 hypothetical protein Nisw_08640 [Candidatus Nitrosopumilus sp. SW]
MSVKCNNEPSINFSAKENLRVLDIIDIPIKVSEKPGIIKQLSEAKNLAKKLKNENVTLEIRFQGDTILKLGKDANPKLAKIVTLSNDIEITNLKKLKKLSEVI